LGDVHRAAPPPPRGLRKNHATPAIASRPAAVTTPGPRLGPADELLPVASARWLKPLSFGKLPVRLATAGIMAYSSVAD